jgi:hypothetical protein
MPARRRSTKKGQPRKTARRAYSGLSKKKAEELSKRNKSLRARLAKSRGGNPFPTGPHLKTEVEAFAFVAAGGGLNGWLSSRILDMQASGTIPAIPGGIKPAWALTALAIAAPAMGWVKGANGARLALVSSGMAAAQASDYFQS